MTKIERIKKLMKTPDQKIERIKYLIDMELSVNEKDDAGIFIPNGMDAAIKIKAYEDCLRVLVTENV